MQVICKTTFSLFGIEPVGPISLNGYGQVGLLSCSLSLIGSVWRRIDLKPFPTRGWSKGGRMGSLWGDSHAIFF
jgi:hypothetical protein